jgi:phosphopantetheine adenylyltransferase
MRCAERLRLQKMYLDAITENFMAGIKIADAKSEAWREATKDTRVVCEETLTNLNSHRSKHGC